MPVGSPPVTQLRALELREVAARIDAIRQRLAALDAEVARLGSVADAATAATRITNLQRALLALTQRVSALELAIGVTDTVILAASAPVAQYDVVVPSVPNQCRTADPNVRTEIHAALGVALNAGGTGSPITIQRGGPLSLPISGLEVGRPVFAGLLGEITQDPSYSVTVIPVGVATSSSAIWISPALALLNQADHYGDAFDEWMPITLACLRERIEVFEQFLGLLDQADGFVYLYQGQLITTPGGPGGGAVDSVNGQIGTVELLLGDLLDVDVSAAEPLDVLSLESGTWRSRRLTGIAFTNSVTAPANPSDGDRWFDPDVGVLYTWIEDGSSSAWVEL